MTDTTRDDVAEILPLPRRRAASTSRRTNSPAGLQSFVTGPVRLTPDHLPPAGTHRVILDLTSEEVVALGHALEDAEARLGEVFDESLDDRHLDPADDGYLAALTRRQGLISRVAAALRETGAGE